MDEIEFIVLALALFGIKHFVCDFLLQNPKMLSQKGTYGAWGGIEHAMVHGLGTWLILLPFFGLFGFVFALFDGFVHYHVDWTKQQFSKGLTPADRKFWVLLGADQALHYLTYIAIIGWIVGAV